MQDLTVSFLQDSIHWHAPKLNHDRIRQLTKSLQHADLIVLPEMFNTGFSNKTSLAQDMNGESVAFLRELSKEKQCAVLGSLMVIEKERVFNRCLVFHDGKLMGQYDKIHLFSMANEDHFFDPGVNLFEFELKGWKIRPLICYDLRFPEVSRNRAKYDLLIYVANWPQKRAAHWNKLLPARAIENQSYVLGCNRIGEDGNGISYSGDSVILNAQGEELLAAKSSAGLFDLTLSKTPMYEWRDKLSALEDIRYKS